MQFCIQLFSSDLRTFPKAEGAATEHFISSIDFPLLTNIDLLF
jgi:hypothetical protein